MISLLAALIMGGTAYGETRAVFSVNQAVIIVHGSDNDPANLFEAMDITPTDVNGVQTKSIFATGTSGYPFFDMTCRKNTSLGVPSCTFKIYSTSAVLDPARRSVLMTLNDRFDAPSVASKFKHADQGEVFKSLNGKLRIWKTFDSDGGVVSFTAQYQE